ncbi:hypothetical protein M3Y94_00167900 [Aphelenchoides besseyi]|nr:hypothetical protein M3Y94_00167900 [Aphelenchoides besseyi]
MDLFVVLDFSCSALQSVDFVNLPKVKNGIQITERLIEEIDNTEVSIHLIVMIGKPKLVKSYIESSKEIKSLVSKSFEEDARKYTPDYAALKQLILSSRNETNYEIVVLTDMQNNSNQPLDLVLSCLLRFVVLTDPEIESLSEYLVANLECVSLRCGLEAGFANEIKDLDQQKHFPIIFNSKKPVDSIALQLAREVRTIKQVTITISPSVSLKADLTPGLPKLVSMIDDEMAYHEIGRDQTPNFRLVGCVDNNMIVKITTGDLVHHVVPTNLTENNDENVELFKVVTDALVSANKTLILLHSSGEECFLRPYKPMIKIENKDEEIEHGLALQFYSSQSVNWKQQNDPLESRSKWEFSYAKVQNQIYWSNGYDLSAEAGKVVRRLKKRYQFCVSFVFL